MRERRRRHDDAHMPLGGTGKRSYRRIKPTAKQMQTAVDAFNAAHKVGETIRVFPGDALGRLDEVQVCEPGAYVLSGHTPVVQVTGGTRADGSPASYGCIALSHVYEPQP